MPNGSEVSFPKATEHQQLIGYEHGFTNRAYDIMRILGGEAPTVPIPDFEDAYNTQRVLEAVGPPGSMRSLVRLGSPVG